MSSKPEASGNDASQYLTFMLGDETLAIGILSIKEILEYDDLTTVPMMPACVRGVINLRGAVVPVMDLAARFGRPSAEISRRTCIVIVEIESENGRHDVGVIVDTVNEVMEIPASEVEPAPSFGAKIRSDFIHGIGKVGGKFVVILDTNHVLSVEEVAAMSDKQKLAA
jgi:purine-binding chemotaxis protein CheW